MSHRFDEIHFNPFVQNVAKMATWACIVMLAVLSLMPSEQMIVTGASDLAEHALAYFLTGSIAAAGYSHRVKAFQLIIGFSVYAAVLEFAQFLAPDRYPDIYDWLAGSIGAILGVCLAAKMIAKRSTR